MTKQIEKILSEALVKAGFFSEAEINKVSSQAGDNLRSYLLKNNLILEEKILKALGAWLNIEVIDLKALTIDKKVIERVPVRFTWYYKFMPVKIEQKILTLAVFYPLEVRAQDEIRVHLGFEPKFVLAKEHEVVETIKKYYGLAADTIDRILTKEPIRKTASFSERDSQVEDIEGTLEDPSVTKLVNQIILEAYQKRATDIHIEPYRNKVRFRYRIDGVLIDANLPEEIKHFLQPVLSRIKIMANLSIVEKRLPQDGSAVVKTKDQTLDLRVSTIPTPNGESLVIRILPAQVILFSLERLGLGEENVKILRTLIQKPHGIILVTGPTGSGKTTTLYACLNEINSPVRKIITIEDPIEYELEGVTQIQVNRKVELDFATGLRSILRHDPDVIMVGEVRDLETAEIAIRTALTGHLVFSTLHTNDAASGVTRLVDMGIEPYLVASSVEAFVAQRLVRIICPHCKEEDLNSLDEVRSEIAQALNMADPKDVKIYRGKGCDRCNQTGFYGRTAIHEILVMNDVIRTAILEKPRADYVQKIACQYGMNTLRHSGWRKVLAGLTTPAEVMNVTTKDEYFKDEMVAATSPVMAGRSAGSLTTVSIVPASVPAVGSVPDLSDRLRVIPKETLSAKNEFDLRIHKRVDARLDLYYKILHGDPQQNPALAVVGMEHAAVTSNVSAGGLVLVTNHFIQMGTILEIGLRLNTSDPVIRCLGRVCRTEEQGNVNLFHIALYYLDMSSADRAKINQFVKEKLKEKGEA